MDARASRSYSADVRIQLALNGHVYSVAQLGPDFVVLRNSSDHPPAIAEITMSVDGNQRRWSVDLVDGISADRRETKIVELLPVTNGIGSH
jgi:hypothetical protein